MKFAIPLFIILVPVLANAEGAKQVLDCTASKICTDAGICTPSAKKTSFTLSPLKIGGAYVIKYNDTTANMQATSDSGPFVWTEDNGTQQTLLAAGDKSILWHRMNTGLPPSSTIHFLTCEDAS